MEKDDIKLRLLQRKIFEFQAKSVNCNGERISDQSLLEECSKWFQSRHYKEVLEERNAERKCGFPLCSQYLREKSQIGKYRIDYKKKTFTEIGESRLFCCTRCFEKSKVYAASLDDSAPSSRPICSSLSSIANESEGIDDVINILSSSKDIKYDDRIDQGLDVPPPPSFFNAALNDQGGFKREEKPSENVITEKTSTTADLYATQQNIGTDQNIDMITLQMQPSESSAGLISSLQHTKGGKQEEKRFIQQSKHSLSSENHPQQLQSSSKAVLLHNKTNSNQENLSSSYKDYTYDDEAISNEEKQWLDEFTKHALAIVPSEQYDKNTPMDAIVTEQANRLVSQEKNKITARKSVISANNVKNISWNTSNLESAEKSQPKKANVISSKSILKQCRSVSGEGVSGVRQSQKNDEGVIAGSSSKSQQPKKKTIDDSKLVMKSIVEKQPSVGPKPMKMVMSKASVGNAQVIEGYQYKGHVLNSKSFCIDNPFSKRSDVCDDNNCDYEQRSHDREVWKEIYGEDMPNSFSDDDDSEEHSDNGDDSVDQRDKEQLKSNTANIKSNVYDVILEKAMPTPSTTSTIPKKESLPRQSHDNNGHNETKLYIILWTLLDDLFGHCAQLIKYDSSVGVESFSMITFQHDIDEIEKNDCLHHAIVQDETQRNPNLNTAESTKRNAFLQLLSRGIASAEKLMTVHDLLNSSSCNSKRSHHHLDIYFSIKMKLISNAATTISCPSLSHSGWTILGLLIIDGIIHNNQFLSSSNESIWNNNTIESMNTLLSKIIQSSDDAFGHMKLYLSPTDLHILRKFFN